MLKHLLTRLSSLKVHLIGRLLGLQHRSEWLRLIRDKTVAIVGPAPPEQDQAEQIEAFDVVIRVGFEHWPWPNTGDRTDVWLLDAVHSRKYLDGSLDVPTATKWVLLKPGLLTLRDVWRIRRKREKVAVLRLPMMSEWVPKAWNPYQVTFALIEMGFLHPIAVSVFGADFYINSGKAYHASSPEFEAQHLEPQTFRRMLIDRHAHFENHKVVRHVRDQWGWLNGDERFISVVDMGEEAFRASFEAEA